MVGWERVACCVAAELEREVSELLVSKKMKRKEPLGNKSQMTGYGKVSSQSC